MLRALHSLSEGKERKKTVTIWPHYHDWAYESCLACQHFMSKRNCWLVTYHANKTMGKAIYCSPLSRRLWEGTKHELPWKRLRGRLLLGRHENHTGWGFRLQHKNGCGDAISMTEWSTSSIVSKYTCSLILWLKSFYESKHYYYYYYY